MHARILQALKMGVAARGGLGIKVGNEKTENSGLISF